MRRYRRCRAPQERRITNEAIRGGANEPAEAPERFPGSSDEAKERTSPSQKRPRRFPVRFFCLLDVGAVAGSFFPLVYFRKTPSLSCLAVVELISWRKMLLM